MSLRPVAVGRFVRAVLIGIPEGAAVGIHEILDQLLVDLVGMGGPVLPVSGFELLGRIHHLFAVVFVVHLAAPSRVAAAVSAKMYFFISLSFFYRGGHALRSAPPPESWLIQILDIVVVVLRIGTHVELDVHPLGVVAAVGVEHLERAGIGRRSHRRSARIRGSANRSRQAWNSGRPVMPDWRRTWSSRRPPRPRRSSGRRPSPSGRAPRLRHTRCRCPDKAA